MLSREMWSVVVIVFCPNDGRDYGLAPLFDQPARTWPATVWPSSHSGFPPRVKHGWTVHDLGYVSTGRMRPSRQIGQRRMSTPNTRRAKSSYVSFVTASGGGRSSTARAGPTNGGLAKGWRRVLSPRDRCGPSRTGGRFPSFGNGGLHEKPAAFRFTSSARPVFRIVVPG